MAINNFALTQLGYFIDSSYWFDALILLNFQISQINKNRHYNNLSFYYYSMLHDQCDLVNRQAYFEAKIASSMFYGLETEFSVIPYEIPKGKFSIRQYRFFTYPARAAYYCIGTYLIRLTQGFLDEYKEDLKHIQSFYGGNLRYYHDGIVVNHENTYYREYYKRFRNSIRSEIEDNLQDRVVVHLDVQNYFDGISIPVLLDILEHELKYTVKQDLKFDGNTKQLIRDFFQFLMKGSSKGIPQADNDIISSFIGYLYLVFGDREIDDLLSSAEFRDIIEEYKIFRYVDDIYILIEFYENVDQKARDKCVDTLTHRIVDNLYQKLALRLNDKSEIFWLCNKDDLEKLKKKLKRTSPDYPSPDPDQQDLSPQKKIEAIFQVLKELKESPINSFVDFDPQSLSTEIMKDIYDDSVEQLLNSEHYKAQLEDLFLDFNFDLVKICPREITILLLKTQNSHAAYKDYLLHKKNHNTWDVNLIFIYLSQTGFELYLLIKNLSKYKPLQDIIKCFEDADIYQDIPGYFNLTPDQLLFINTLPQAIEQIILRRRNEWQREFSTALNHLVNEIQYICWKSDATPNKPQLKDYNVKHVSKFLLQKKIPNTVRTQIKNLFDRRNNNKVSHPSSDGKVTSGVTEQEYNDYKVYVGKCLSMLL